MASFLVEFFKTQEQIQKDMRNLLPAKITEGGEKQSGEEKQKESGEESLVEEPEEGVANESQDEQDSASIDPDFDNLDRGGVNQVVCLLSEMSFVRNF